MSTDVLLWSAVLAPCALLLWRFLRGRRPDLATVRYDEDFGRLGLFADGLWRGAVELAGLERPLDLEIQALGAGPTLAHRLAWRDARARWSGMEPEIRSAARGSAAADPCFLTLRLPSEDRMPECDWEVEGLLEEGGSGTAFRVRVSDGRVAGVEHESL